MKKYINLAFCSLFFFTPLLLYPKTSEVFEFNKMLFVYALTGIILSLWLSKSLLEKKFILVRTPLDLPILLFLLSQIISTILSIDPHTSIYGYYSRFHGGLASTVCYLILFYALVSNINTKKEISFLIYSLLGSSFLVAGYAILEHFGIDKDLWVQDVQNRVFSTLGQPNWLSAYLIALLPLSLHFAFPKKGEKSPNLLFTFLSLTIFTAILFTKSQSGIATTFIILFIFFIIQLFSKHHPNLSSRPTPPHQGRGGIPACRQAWPFNSITYVILPFIITTFLIGSPYTPSLTQIQTGLTRGGPLYPFAEKYLNQIHLTTQIKPIDETTLSPTEKEYVEYKKKGLRYGGSDSMEIRRVVWQGAFELAKRYPLFGTGVETFGYSYFWVRPTAHNLLSEWDFLYNKAHNEYLNLLATTGFVGLLTYLFLIFSILKTFINTKFTLNSIFTVRTLERTNNHQTSTLAKPLLLGFLSILITNYFGFSVVNIALFFFLFPAVLLADGHENPKTFTFSLKQAPLYLSLLVVILATIYHLNSVRLLFISDINYNLGKNHLVGNSLKPALDSLTLAHSQNPDEPVITATLAETEAQAAVAIDQQLDRLSASDSAKIKASAQESIKLYQNAYTNHINQVITQNPYHTNFYKSKAKSEIYLSSIDPKYLEQAAATLLHLTTLTPTDAKSFYNLGIVYLNLHQQDQAITALKKALELKPDYDSVKQLDIINKIYPD